MEYIKKFTKINGRININIQQKDKKIKKIV